jgi:hypothetical protein
MAKPAWPPPTTSVSTFSVDIFGSFFWFTRISVGRKDTPLFYIAQAATFNKIIVFELLNRK